MDWRQSLVTKAGRASRPPERRTVAGVDECFWRMLSWSAWHRPDRCPLSGMPVSLQALLAAHTILPLLVLFSRLPQSVTT